MPDETGAGSTRPSPAPQASPVADDGRLHAPSFARNHEPIAAALAPLLGMIAGPVLEIGCGTGQHAATLAAAYPDRLVLPSDIFPEHRASADAWGRAGGLANLAEARDLDAATDWAPTVADVAPFALVLAINVVHIAPWAVAEGIVRGAARVVAPGGHLAFYGPFVEPGKPLAESNLVFDRSLRERHPEWGIRSVAAVAGLATLGGLAGPAIQPMPANNIILHFRKPG